MKIRNLFTKIAPVGIGLAIIASPFMYSNLAAHADGFDGKAYLVWDCNEENACYHLFSDIKTDNSYTIYADGFSADNSGKTFSAKNINIETTTFVLKTAFDSYLSNHTSYPITDIMEAEDGEGERIALNPLEAPIETNAYSHFGDRKFKVMIKSPEYTGVSVKNATDGYEPDFGNALNTVVYRDISGSTESNPVILYTIPQQEQIIISGENGTAFDSIEALNLNKSQAVNISSVSSGHKIQFNSNYYDHIIFKVTSGTSIGYIQIFRTAIQVQKVDISPNSNTLNAIIYFDSTKNCSSYDLFAKLAYKNGNEKTVKLSPASEHDDGYGNIESGCLANGGTNLKKGYYSTTIDTNLINLSGVYFTAINAGSTITNYAGTLSGSKKGVYLNLEETPITNQKYATIQPKGN